MGASRASAVKLLDATMIHAQSSTPPDDTELKQIVDFESGIFTAQARANGSVDLSSNGGKGGPVALSTQTFFIGINDPFGANPMGTPFDPNIFNLFEAWATPGKRRLRKPARIAQSIARGEQIFNTKTFTIAGVAGPQRCARASLDHRHLRHLSRHAQPRQSLDRWPLGHRHLGSIARSSGAAAAGLHHPLRYGPARGPDLVHLRSGTRADHRKVRGHRQGQGAASARPRGAGAVFP